jgi:hypothetical protein
VINKFGQDSEEITNNWPISNIKLIGKLIESEAHTLKLSILNKLIPFILNSLRIGNITELKQLYYMSLKKGTKP